MNAKYRVTICCRLCDAEITASADAVHTAASIVNQLARNAGWKHYTRELRGIRCATCQLTHDQKPD